MMVKEIMDIAIRVGIIINMRRIMYANMKRFLCANS